MKSAIIIISLFLSVSVFAQKFSTDERKLIESGDTKTMLKVIQTTDEKELKILKSVSKDIDFKAELLQLLADRMYLSMRDPANPGIGIAAPQIGINRNIIWVQRFDKEGQPFELYINPKIIWKSEELIKGQEGCLSIPDIMGNVYRSKSIKLTYQDKSGKFHEELIDGFTAVIFQHETDHLLGILFTDRMKEQDTKQYLPLENYPFVFIESKTSKP